MAEEPTATVKPACADVSTRACSKNARAQRAARRRAQRNASPAIVAEESTATVDPGCVDVTVTNGLGLSESEALKLAIAKSMRNINPNSNPNMRNCVSQSPEVSSALPRHHNHEALEGRENHGYAANILPSAAALMSSAQTHAVSPTLRAAQKVRRRSKKKKKKSKLAPNAKRSSRVPKSRIVWITNSKTGLLRVRIKIKVRLRVGVSG